LYQGRKKRNRRADHNQSAKKPTLRGGEKKLEQPTRNNSVNLTEGSFPSRESRKRQKNKQGKDPDQVFRLPKQGGQNKPSGGQQTNGGGRKSGQKRVTTASPIKIYLRPETSAPWSVWGQRTELQRAAETWEMPEEQDKFFRKGTPVVELD